MRLLHLANVWAICAGVFFAAGAGSGHAQDIRWKPEALRPGDVIVLEQDPYGRIHHVYRGRSGQAHVTQSFRGARVAGTPVFTTLTDDDGNHLRFTRADGTGMRYVPHDCSRTIGRCTYVEQNFDGTSERRMRITEATSTGFRFREFGEDGTPLFGGQFELDSRGNAGAGRVEGQEGRVVTRVVGRSYE